MKSGTRCIRHGILGEGDDASSRCTREVANAGMNTFAGSLGGKKPVSRAIETRR